MRKIARTLKWVAVGAVLVTLFGLAGRMDYTDNVVSEMKNKGVYETYCENHPDMDDNQIADLYMAEKK